MSLLPVEQPRFDEMENVIKLWVQNENPTSIAKELGIRRVDVLNHIDEWRRTKVGGEVMRERFTDLVSSMDEHYSLLIKKAYEIVDEVDELRKSDKETMTRSQMLSQKKGALDLIAKLEKDRLDILQKSGASELDHLGDMLAQLEDEKNIILDAVEHELCDSCKPKLLMRMASALNNNATVVVVGDTKG